MYTINILQKNYVNITSEGTCFMFTINLCSEELSYLENTEGTCSVFTISIAKGTCLMFTINILHKNLSTVNVRSNVHHHYFTEEFVYSIPDGTCLLFTINILQKNLSTAFLTEPVLCSQSIYYRRTCLQHS